MLGTRSNLRPPAHEVSWRDGVHLEGTSIWCDALRARDICFVSRADALAQPRHGQLIATRETLALVDRVLASRVQRARRSKRADSSQSELSVPFGRPFTLGTLRLELVRTGYAVGAAGLFVTNRDRRLLYAGSINPRGGGLGGSADVRECDVLVLSAHYGSGELAFESTDRAAARAIDFAAEVTGKGGAAVLLVSSPARALDVAVRLSEAGIELSAHRSIHLAARRLRQADLPLPVIRRFTAHGAATGRALLWPMARAAELERDQLPASSRIALVSGEALYPTSAARFGADLAIGWSGGASRDELVAYLESSGARTVYLVGRHAEELAATLDGGRRTAVALGPPVQMSLFG